MPDIEVLDILKISCEVIDSQQACRKFDSQIMWSTGALKCKTHMVEEHRTDSEDANQSNVNILDYFMSSESIEADRGASMSIA